MSRCGVDDRLVAVVADAVVVLALAEVHGMSWWRRIGCTTSRVSPASSGCGSVHTSWCCTATSGIGTPAIAPTVGPQMPAQISTRSHSIPPRSVSHSVHAAVADVEPGDRHAALERRRRAPRLRARAPSRSARPSRCRRSARSTRPGSRPGRAAGSARRPRPGVSSSVSSIPYDRANPCRRCSSAMRSGVVATSMPPTPYQPGTPSSSSDP